MEAAGAGGSSVDPSRHGSLDLRRCSVFIDFDGTVSTHDVGTHLLRRLVAEDWEAIDERYLRGEIGSRQCITELCSLLPDDVDLLLEVASEVPLDAGFGPLVEFLRTAGAEVLVVSDGFGFYVAPRCAPFVLGVVASGLVDGCPVFPNADPTCPCAACGTCKARAVRDASRRARTTVLVGDGASDRFGAEVAELVFAKPALAELCRRLGLPCVEFGVLAEVESALRLLAIPASGRQGELHHRTDYP